MAEHEGLKQPMRLSDVPFGAEVCTGRDWVGPTGIGKVVAVGRATAGYPDGGSPDDVAVHDRSTGRTYCWRYWQVEVLGSRPDA